MNRKVWKYSFERMCYEPNGWIQTSDEYPWTRSLSIQRSSGYYIIETDDAALVKYRVVDAPPSPPRIGQSLCCK